ncbi:MAG: DUF3786 domain-containing protein [Candidatus Firestonebacteria bacterium]|nr:DUF3786 domain-containing protein [Candidatus Firestonebacteria bacterium]
MYKKSERESNTVNLFPGENDLWQKLLSFSPEDVCKRSGAKYIKGKVDSYMMPILNSNYNFFINREITPEIHPHLKFIALLYLVQVKEDVPTGKLCALHELKGGQFFFQGGHELPLTQLADKYGKDKNIEDFYQKGISLGGTKAFYGDASFVLWPFPKIPITYILWKEDVEFPARITILFDETIEKHMVLEGICGTAFLTTKSLLS